MQTNSRIQVDASELDYWRETGELPDSINDAVENLLDGFEGCNLGDSHELTLVVRNDEAFINRDQVTEGIEEDEVDEADEAGTLVETPAEPGNPDEPLKS